MADTEKDVAEMNKSWDDKLAETQQTTKVCQYRRFFVFSIIIIKYGKYNTRTLIGWIPVDE